MRFLLIPLLILLVWSCTPSTVYEGSKDIEKRIWIADSVLSFDFDVKNPSLPHEINLAIRNTGNYPFYNLYVVYYLKDSTGNIISTDLVNHNLFDPKTGESLGSGIGGIYSHTFPIVNQIKFDHAGKYQLDIEQNMRLDSLIGIVSVGVQVDNSVN